jgi:hypothetical protein
VKKSAAFTLVEMLVSVAVLILIMAFVTQMMNSTTISTTMSGKNLDADTQARLVFDRMAADFAGMPHRTDVDFIFSKQPNLASPPSGATAGTGSNDVMFFYSEAPSYYDSTLFSGTTNTALESSVALVGYSCINTSVATATLPAFSLARFSKGLTWDAQPSGGTAPGGMVFLTFLTPSVNPSPIPASTFAGNPAWSGDIGPAPTYTVTTSTDYQEYTDVLSNDVLRLEFCFEVKNLTNPASPGSAYSSYPVARIGTGLNTPNSAGNQTTVSYNAPQTPMVGDRWYDTVNNRAYICTSGPVWTPNGMADVKAIVVAIAMLDQTSRKLLSATQLGSISAAFVDPTEDTNSTTGLLATSPHLMAEVWQNTLNEAGPTLASATGVPKTAAAQVRVYQRFFYLNNP